VSETTGGTKSKYLAAVKGRDEAARFLKLSRYFEIVFLRFLILGRDFVIARSVLRKLFQKTGRSQLLLRLLHKASEIVSVEILDAIG
jgi:hypothetical protein